MATVSGGTTSERFGFIQTYGRQLGVRYLCNWLGVSRSGYYDWLRRKPSNRQKEDVELLDKIRKVHDKHREVYGSPRIHHCLQSEGVVVGQNRVARLMRENGIKGRVATVTQRRPKQKGFYQAGENLRLKAAKPKEINEQWVADITYIKVGMKHQHLITIMDVYSRRILGWSLCENRTAEDVLRVLRRVIGKRQPKPGLIFHTDRGIEFMAYTIQDELGKHGLLRSYNRIGFCTDNAHMESFYHSLKGELIRGRKFLDADQLRQALSSYINKFYNQERIHSGIEYLSPINYEQRAA